MTRGRPKNLENMTQEERVQYWDNRERQAIETMTPAQRGAIEQTQWALTKFVMEWTEHFDITDPSIPRELQQAMVTLQNHFDIWEK